MRRLAAICLATLLASPAQAQFLAPVSGDLADEADAVRQSVGQRPRPEFEPIGLRLGDLAALPFGGDGLGRLPELRGTRPAKGTDAEPAPIAAWLRDGALNTFLLFPKLETSVVYEDNVFRNDRARRGDLLLRLRPSLELRSDWANHRVALQASSDIGRYRQESTEDYADLELRGFGRIDITEDARLNLRAGYRRSHETRGAGEGASPALQGREPTIFSSTTHGLTWSYQRDAFLLRLRWDGQYLDYRDNDVRQSDRDRWHYDVAARAGWEAWPGTVLWIEPAYAIRDYDDSTDFSGLNRDNQGPQVLIGFTWNRNAVTFAEIGVGWYHRSFDDPALEDFAGPSAQARVVWNLARLVTLETFIARTIAERSVLFGNAAEQTRGGLKVTWDPRENLIFDAGLRLTRLDYQPDSFGFEDREDWRTEVDIRGKYLFNPNLYAELRYAFDRLESTADFDDYSANSWSVTLGARL